MEVSPARPPPELNLSAVASQAIRRIHSWATDPQLRRLRVLLTISASIQLILAPLTAWSVDTPGFISGSIGFLYAGNPYLSNLYINPPLAPLLQSPGFFALSRFVPPSQWLQLDPHVIPAEAATGMASALLPDPVALLVLKLPLIAGMLLTGVFIGLIGQKWGWSPRTMQSVLAAWWLNPLVIWATAVHGEVDVLAALCVAAALWTIQQGFSPLVSGILISVGFFSKLYPVLLLPLFFALLWSRRNESGRLHTMYDWGLASAGFGVGALPFLPFVTYTVGALSHSYASPVGGPSQFGGLSPLVLFNHQIAALGPVGDRFFPGTFGEPLHLVFVALLIASLAIGVWLLSRRDDRAPTKGSGSLPPQFVAVALWVLAAVLLNYPAPQPENVLAVLVPLLLLSPDSRDRFRWAYWILSGLAWSLYLALLTPMAYFYPAARLLGDRFTPTLNAAIIAYHSNRWIPPIEIWTALGVGAGVILLTLWVGLARDLLRRKRTATPNPTCGGLLPEAHD